MSSPRPVATPGKASTELASEAVSFSFSLAEIGIGVGGLAAFGDSASSAMSLRNSPSSVNKRRSVTVKPDSCLFSAIKRILVVLYKAISIKLAILNLVQHRIFRLSQCDAGKWQLSYCRLDRAYHNFAPRNAGLAPNVSQSNRPLARRRVQRSNAGDLAGFLFRRDDLFSSCDCGSAFHQKAGELAMYVSARANALHNLLPYITALAEIERAHLLSLLRQVALANVCAIERDAGHDALHFQCLAAHWSCPSTNQRLPRLVNIFRSEPDFVGLILRILATHDLAFYTIAVAHTLWSHHLQRLHFGSFNSCRI